MADFARYLTNGTSQCHGHLTYSHPDTSIAAGRFFSCLRLRTAALNYRVKFEIFDNGHEFDCNFAFGIAVLHLSPFSCVH